MHIKQAYQLLQQGHLEKARDLCSKLIQLSPPSAQSLVLMSAIQQRLGDVSAATVCLLQAADLQSADTRAQLSIIKALRTIGAVDEASKLLRQLDQNQPEVVISQAQVDWHSGQYSQSMEGFESAVERWPEHAEASFALARAWLRLAEPDRAESILLKADRRWPNSEEIKRLLAIVELDRGDPQAALQHLRGKIPMQPRNSPGRKLLSALLWITGQPEPAKLSAIDFVPNGFPAEDFIDRSFAWAKGQATERSGEIAWFGTNSGLLRWASRQIPAGFDEQGPVVECGVYHGFSLRLLSDQTARPIHGFDSFQGLPEMWKPGEPAGSYSTRGRVPATAAHVQLHPGWFERTLPDFSTQLNAPIALLHVDCDLYSSTWTVLTHLGPRLAPGSLLVFDDFLSYEGYEQHEFRAAHEYFAASAQQFELVGAVLLGRAVAYRLVSS